MGNQEKIDKLTVMGKKLFLFGTLTLAVLFITTFFFSSIITPLQQLQLRLAIIGAGFVYSGGVFFFIHRGLTNLAGKGEERTMKEVIISFNGKELGKM
ncbi:MULTISPECIES: hypothetical protein [Bacillaceae]|uniref:Uncharacterized protein n=1 Tax=Evansella alkalicola TaxID=745819 RepID=A0ABS6JWX0_9BACI|nr:MULTISPECIES: hypothetical protein [Bacillaceae]MBU9722988.1 hypothetical protein [Bacillus alkalicola]